MAPRVCSVAPLSDCLPCHVLDPHSDSRGFAMAVTAAELFTALILIAGFLGVYLSLRREIRKASKETLSNLLDMMRKGHGYSDPSGAAVVTEGTPSPAPAL